MEKDFFKIFMRTSTELAYPRSKDELITSFLNCFITISECKSVSLYLVDQNSFEINLAGISGENSKEEIEKTFLELVENEVIAELLNNPNGTVNYKTKDYQICILPIKGVESITGFFIFIFQHSGQFLPETDFLLNHYCNFFSLQMISFTYNENQPGSVKKFTESANSNINFLTQHHYNLLNFLKEGILVVEKNTGKIVDANESAINILKIKKENIIGTEKSRYFLFLDKNLFMDEIISEDETLLIAADGTVIPVLFSTRIFKINDSDYEIISFLDISERKSMEDLILQSRFHLEQTVEERTRELLISKSKIEKAFNIKNALLANMSHEFRTPLISIIGFSQLLQDEIVDLENAEMVKAIFQGGNRLLNTLDNVLILSDLESGKTGEELESVDLIPLIKIHSDKYQYLAEDQGLGFEFINKSSSLVANINRFFFNRTMEILIENALKYTPSGWIRISTEIVEKDNQEFIGITVTDTGIGVKDTDKELIFEAFRQSEEGHTRNFEGSGLGLTIAQKAINMMHGTISLTDNPGGGSQFSLYLPVARNHPGS